ncbi:MAG TPA: CDP-alcohol phosphatidyltransferase family protein [Patescibacteria group bacterium]|nr:CDP-alcohol phosphatidyltransferase family protein [Patescibacteria group bacterium]
MINRIKKAVRRVMGRIAAALNRISGGAITPNAITIIGFAMHVPIALLVASRHNVWAAILLFIFGLFDTLDGELARLQKRDSTAGMLLDASTDRLKEMLIYSGAAYALALSSHPATAAWAAAACGASISVSYVKAKGEAAVAMSGKKLTHSELNHLFDGGILSFEIRMFILVVGLFANQLVIAVAIIAVFASYTALQRLIRITKQLS